MLPVGPGQEAGIKEKAVEKWEQGDGVLSA